MNYKDFLASKEWAAPSRGIEHGEIHPVLFGYQRETVRRLLEMGCGAAFLDTGLGKTAVQCEWARHVPGRVLFVAPLAVAQQTQREAKRLLGMEIEYCKDGTSSAQFVITNYERVTRFDPAAFAGVVLDESSILKSFMGATKRDLCERFASTPYRLACTATPAPNDFMEVGNHSEFLGVMPGTEMLTRWFINDAASVGTYRLKGHAVADFWRWVASWSVTAAKPSDLGFSDEGFILPELRQEILPVESPLGEAAEAGELFYMPVANAANLHKERRKSIEDRVRIAAGAVNGNDRPWLIWCESNEESAALTAAIPDAVEVKGSDSAELKESRLVAFSEGRARVMVSKPSICGFGMNWQHCRDMIFSSVSYSYEKYYQAVRRCWRFGQTQPVHVRVLLSDMEIPVWKTVVEKAGRHEEMKRNSADAGGMDSKRAERVEYKAKSFSFPEWISKERRIA